MVAKLRKLESKVDLTAASKTEAILDSYRKAGLSVANEDITVKGGKHFLFEGRYWIKDPSNPTKLIDTESYGKKEVDVEYVPELLFASARERMQAARDALKAAGLSTGPINLWRAVQLQVHGLEVRKETVESRKAFKAAIADAEKRDEVKMTNFLWNLPPHALGGLKEKLKDKVLEDFLKDCKKKGLDPVADYDLAVTMYENTLNSRRRGAFDLALRGPTIMSPASAALAFLSLGTKMHYLYSQLKGKIVNDWVEQKDTVVMEEHTRDKVSYTMEDRVTSVREPIGVEEVTRTETVPHPTTQADVIAGVQGHYNGAVWSDLGDSSQYSQDEYTLTVRNTVDVSDSGNIKHIIFVESFPGPPVFDDEDPQSQPFASRPQDPRYFSSQWGVVDNENMKPLGHVVQMPDGSLALAVPANHTVHADHYTYQGGDFLEYHVYPPGTEPEPDQFTRHIYAAGPATLTQTHTEQVVVYGPAQERHEQVPVEHHEQVTVKEPVVHHETVQHHEETPVVKTHVVEDHREWFIAHWDRLVASFALPLGVLGISLGYQKWNAFAAKYASSTDFRDDLALKMVGQMETF